MSTARELYLDQQWDRYPSATGLKWVGRLELIHHSRLALFRGTQVKIQIPIKKIKDWGFWKEILIPGDIIGIKSNGQCVLLAAMNCSQYQYETEVAQKISFQKNWNRFIDAINLFFKNRRFLSVSTPSLVSNPGPEPSIDAFKTDYKQDRKTVSKYLITSPELHLKKIISQTLSPVYEITKVYRNNEHSSKHSPEFYMLEWYRPFCGLEDIVKDVKDLILFLIKTLKLKQKKPNFENTTFKDVLKTHFQFEFTPQSTAIQLKECLSKNKIYFSPDMSIDDLFTLINLELVEPKLNKNEVTFLNNYPPYAAALAKLDKEGWAQRFEVYWKDIELGNAFYELNDPTIQEQRFKEDNLKKKANNLEPLPIDTDFLNHLNQGMPPAAGISIGLERLFMVLFDEKDINKTKWFPPN